LKKRTRKLLLVGVRSPIQNLPRQQKSKNILVLFFKKEHTSFLLRRVEERMLKSGIVALACLAAGPAIAAATLPTNLPGARTFPAPPAGFNALTASDSDLAAYGFPARPNPFEQRKAYAAWSHFIAHARVQVAPILKTIPYRHRPMISAGPPPAATRLMTAPRQANTSYSTNWSGEVLTDNATYYAYGSFYAIWGDFNVPIGEQQFGTCTGGTEYSSVWVGMDGAPGAASDVVQAGTESDAACYGGYTTPTYYAWYEWYPAYTVEISNFPVTAGQDVEVEVAMSGSTTAAVYMTNATTNQYVAIAFDAPAGTKFVGNSAEWIVERPDINNKLSSLANYVTQYISDTVVLMHGRSGGIFGGTGAYGVPMQSVTMLQNNAAISVPSTIGASGVQISTTGAAN
jgi:hypothetical protein